MSAATRFEGRLAVIGGGRMGEAIVGGLTAAGALVPGRVTIAEPDDARREHLAKALPGVALTASGKEAAKDADTVILAVKPQVMDAVVSELAGALDGTLVVSIAAGISCARVESLLPAGTRVVRVMPNTPALVGEGVALVSGGTEALADDVAVVTGLFSAIGTAVVIEERYQDAGTAISGSGPAYFALVVDALARAGVAHGLQRSTAQELAVKTMRGTARLIEETGIHPEELIDGVSSPGGTTIAAISALEAGGVRTAFSEAVSAAVRRARELGV
jgi:pyrroline-5-carboxylate reductase